VNERVGGALSASRDELKAPQATFGDLTVSESHVFRERAESAAGDFRQSDK